ncbi:hypothetical protein CMK13_04585 [Candidatus Poribacteria bacterium]|nr:hypothetical protein [Candidatus Poribacteria bacterium]OUT64456.1 MAG: hypothetical protein CBB75_04290 [bacterium TMED15]
MNENTKDTSGNNNDGEIIGKVGSVAGKFGEASLLDASGIALKIARNLSFELFMMVFCVNVLRSGT